MVKIVEICFKNLIFKFIKTNQSGSNCTIEIEFSDRGRFK